MNSIYNIGSTDISHSVEDLDVSFCSWSIFSMYAVIWIWVETREIPLLAIEYLGSYFSAG